MLYAPLLPLTSEDPLPLVSGNMANTNRIDISFPAGSGSLPESGGSTGRNDQLSEDMALRAPNVIEDLRIGQHTVAEVVAGLQTILGLDLYVSNVLQGMRVNIGLQNRDSGLYPRQALRVNIDTVIMIYRSGINEGPLGATAVQYH